jgi:hypothetical protein
MTTNLVNNQYAQMGAKLGEEIGNKLVARLQQHAATKREPVAEQNKFKDGTPLASDLTPDEAKALGNNLHLVGEYVNDIDNHRYLGVTLESFAEDRIYNGPADDSLKVTADLLSAISKQSAEFSSHYMTGK